MLRVLSARWRSLVADRRGSAAFEYAIVAPLLFVTIFAVIEYGFVFYGYSAMQFGANSAARSIAINKIATSGAADAVNSYLPKWMPPSTVTVTNTLPSDATRSWIQITATAPASSTSPINVFTTVIPWTMTTSVAVKQELPYDN